MRGCLFEKKNDVDLNSCTFAFNVPMILLQGVLPVETEDSVKRKIPEKAGCHDKGSS